MSRLQVSPQLPVNRRKCVGFAVNINPGGTAQTVRTIGYRAGRGIITNTAWVNAVRLSADTWLLEPRPQSLRGADDPLNSVARVRDSATKGKNIPDIDYGRYSMPFRLTLTRQ
jgi:hypothetical protein